MKFTTIVFFTSAGLTAAQPLMNIAGKFEKDVASPDTYINLGQKQVFTKNQVGSGRFYHRRHTMFEPYHSKFVYSRGYPFMRYNPGTFVHHGDEHFDLEPYHHMTKLYRRNMDSDTMMTRGSGSPSIEVSTDAVTNEGQTARSLRKY